MHTTTAASCGSARDKRIARPTITRRLSASIRPSTSADPGTPLTGGRSHMSDEFDQLLAETGITFVPPAGFSPFPVRTSCAFRYQRAYRHASGVEARVRIDSLRRIKAQLKGALPGNFSESAFFTGITNLSGGKAGVRELGAESARRFYKADWV